MAHTLWDGPSTWRADLGLFCTYLKTAGRAHYNLRQMRTLDHYGPAPDSAVFDHLVEHSMEMYGKLISASHQEAPDIDLVVLDLPGTPARRLAGRLAHVAIHWLVPKVRWGAHMQALDTRVQNVPTAEQYWLLLRRTSLDNCVDVASMIDAEARATLLMAFCASPGREVLTARAVGFAQLREATARGAPVGSMTLEFEATLRAHWRSLGCPPCSWLTAVRGPIGPESEAWGQQRESLIQTVLQGLSTLDLPAPTIAPKSYAFISCEHRPDAQDTKTAEQPESMFACDLTSTERQVLRALEGKTLVILGGICKPYAKAALIRDLHLRDLDWIESTEYDHGQQAVSRLRDPNIAVVVFALR